MSLFFEARQKSEANSSRSILSAPDLTSEEIKIPRNSTGNPGSKFQVRTQKMLRAFEVHIRKVKAPQIVSRL